MNKAELVDALAKKYGFSVSKANDVVSHILELMSEALAKEDVIQLIGFGSFAVKKHKAREGRNPKTGELSIVF